MTDQERVRVQFDIAKSYLRDAARALKTEDYRTAESCFNLAITCLKRAESAAADAASQ